jgi:hypothetical protein
MLVRLTPEGNQAAQAEFYGPSGPCGWDWDSYGQYWYYNGPCDQPVVNVTSIAALGSNTITTLSDGRVFAPGALGELSLSHLIPKVDGGYLGAGAAGQALVNLAVMSEEPAPAFGPWSYPGGSAAAPFASVPYMVQIDFQGGYCGTSSEWRVGPCPGEVLTPDEQVLIRNVALQAMRSAYQGYNVTFTTERPSAPRHISMPVDLSLLKTRTC